MKLFIPLTKVDEAKRQVWGLATAEKPDRAGEICDFDWSLPHFQKWSQEVKKASGGLSLGNVRGQHGDVAAGRVIAFDPDPATKSFPVGVEVVDDNEWEKVKKGVYTGFSIGGNYGRRERKNGHTRYEAIPDHLALADVPCLTEATFLLVKADGSEEQRHFEARAEEPEKRGLVDRLVKAAAPDDTTAPETLAAETPAAEGEPLAKADGDTPPEAPAEEKAPEAPAETAPEKAADGFAAWDIRSALTVLEGLRCLKAVETGEGEVPEQVKALDEAIAAIKRFIASEVAELPGEDAPTAEADGVMKAIASGLRELKALLKAPRPVQAELTEAEATATPAPEDLFKVHHGDELADAIGTGLKGTEGRLSKAVAEVGARLDAIGETLAKVAKYSAIPTPVRTEAAAPQPFAGSGKVAYLTALLNTNQDNPSVRVVLEQQLAFARVETQQGA